MVCQAVQMWSLSGLVAAYLDLAIAYLLLCASVVAYVASKFLGFLGLNLPCPCGGMFFNIHSRSICLNSLLVDFPTQKVSDVQLSIKHRFPFSDSTCPKKQNHSTDGGNNGYANGVLEFEGEASCSSVSDARKPIDMKGKGVVGYRQSRGRFRKHRKASGGNGKYSSVSSYDPPLHEPYSSVSSYDPPLHVTHKGENGFIGGSDDDVHVKRSIISNEDQPDNPQELQISNLDDKTAIRLLEETLEEERIARAALYNELEKERSAAASAADEAMAMILRLQEEKASVEMESRQYQRMIEGKSAYDAEEMIILKEILIRREMEKHFLEKEVEAYRRMSFEGNEQLGPIDSSDKSDGRLSFGSSWFDPNDDPVPILHQLAASIDKNVTKDHIPNSNPLLGVEYSFEKKQDSVSNISVGSLEDQEKEIISIHNSLQSTSKGSQECEKTMPLDTKELQKIQENGENVVEKIIGTCNEAEGNVRKSCSGICYGLPPIGPSRRNSLSAVNSEMLKIDSEVGRLRERLKLVREEREKVSLSVGNRERENVQLKLLEDIARQIQEIRQLNTPGRAVRQASLPVPTSKGLSKKRRSRSVSSGFQRLSQAEVVDINCCTTSSSYI